MLRKGAVFSAVLGLLALLMIPLVALSQPISATSEDTPTQAQPSSLPVDQGFIEIPSELESKIAASDTLHEADRL